MRGRSSRGRRASNSGWARDLGLVVALVAITNLVLFGVDAPEPIVWLLGVPFLLVLPGYAIVSAVFPVDTGRVRRSERAQPWHEPDHLVRIALSLMVSAVVLALVGVVLSIGSAIRLGPSVVTISAVTLIGVAIATVRRFRADPSERAMPFGDDSRFWGRLSSGSNFQNGVAIVALLVLVGTLAVTGAAPPQGESFTEFYVLSEDGNGTLTAQEYPQTFVSGQGQTLYVGLENHEHEAMSYEVVMLAQAIGDDGSVVMQQQVDRFEVNLAQGENTTVEREVAPTLVGDQIRLQLLLYKGSAPDDPSSGTADQTLQIWIDVVER